MSDHLLNQMKSIALCVCGIRSVGSKLRFAGGHNASSGYDLPEENETGVSSQPYLPARSSRSSLRAVRTQMELQR